ncbi:DNA cytosine methyltransferase [Caryophanon latum]|uniref:DNA (cytosine-5-)-methyltransferase n=1 Tax=Caryophanon latum TaxID=33977 RepID=A0A1C0YVP9_9BACL|nr:DNA cytosine methyltransferase [Caryophanon latum]OCS91226.1 DNA (cytosine-5-)-methyltransferase [Caryophanon latum]
MNNIISFFAGAGGMDLGFEQAGFDIKLAVEIDPIMCQTLELNRKNDTLTIYEKNILDATAEEVLQQAKLRKGEVAGMIGGSPCQSFSTAGNRGAFSDERGQAMIKYIDLINAIRPKFFVLENVKGLLSAALEHVSIEDRKKNKDEGIVLRAEQQPGSAFSFILNRIQGYEVHYKLLNSADYGVPQKRERVFVIGILKEDDEPLFPYAFPKKTHSKSAKIKETLFDYADDAEGFEPWITFEQATAHLKGTTMNYQSYSEKRMHYMKMIPVGGGNWRDLEKFGDDVVRQAMGGAYNSGGGKVGFFRRIKASEPAPTLLTSPAQNSTNLGHPFEDRPLSIEEYLAIQQFPKNYKVAGKLMDQYKQIGNAVPVGLAYAVAKSIKEGLQTIL